MMLLHWHTGSTMKTQQEFRSSSCGSSVHSDVSVSSSSSGMAGIPIMSPFLKGKREETLPSLSYPWQTIIEMMNIQRRLSQHTFAGPSDWGVLVTVPLCTTTIVFSTTYVTTMNSGDDYSEALSCGVSKRSSQCTKTSFHESLRHCWLEIKCHSL